MERRVLLLSTVFLLCALLIIVITVYLGFNIKSSTNSVAPRASKIILFGGWPKEINSNLELYYPGESTKNGRLGIRLYPGREDHIAARLNDRIAITGGQDSDSSQNLASSVYLYFNLTWGRAPSMSRSRRWPAGALVEGHLYVCCGSSVSFDTDGSCEYLKLEENRWVAVQSDMRVPRRGAMGAAIGQYLFIAGGEGSSSYESSMERLDTHSETWKTMAPMSGSRFLFGFAAVGNNLFSCGGLGGSASRRCEKYDSVSNKWASMPSMKTGREYFLMLNFNDKLFVLGGRGDRRSKLKGVEYFDPTLDTSWKAMDDLLIGREDYAAVSL